MDSTKQNTQHKEKFTVVKITDFAYGHRLLYYTGKCQHLHGHNAKIMIHCENKALDNRGMVVDFSEIKAAIKKVVDEKLDHTLILHEKDPMCALLISASEKFVMIPDNPTAENLARWIYNNLRLHGLNVAKVIFWETDDSYATYSKENTNANS